MSQDPNNPYLLPLWLSEAKLGLYLAVLAAIYVFFFAGCAAAAPRYSDSPRTGETTYLYGPVYKRAPTIHVMPPDDLEEVCGKKNRCCTDIDAGVIFADTAHCLTHELAHYYFCGHDEKCARLFDWPVEDRPYGP